MKIELKTLVDYYDDAIDASYIARVNAEECRDFYDGNQLDANATNPKSFST
jgi:hypothetical protein